MFWALGGMRSDNSGGGPKGLADAMVKTMANLRTKILDFRGFDTSIILILRGGVLVCIGGFPEIVSQRILAGMILAGGLGALHAEAATAASRDDKNSTNSNCYST